MLCSCTVIISNCTFYCLSFKIDAFSLLIFCLTGKDLKKYSSNIVHNQTTNNVKVRVNSQLDKKFPTQVVLKVDRKAVNEAFCKQPKGDDQLLQKIKSQMLDSAKGRGVQRIAIVGQAQIGKNYLLNQLLSTIQNNYQYVFYISLKCIDLSEKMNLLEFLTNQSNLKWTQSKSNLDIQIVQQVVQKLLWEEQKKVCIILDDIEKSDFCFHKYYYQVSPYEESKAGYFVSNILRSWFRNGKKILLLSPWQYNQLKRIPELNPTAVVFVQGIDYKGQKQIIEKLRSEKLEHLRSKCVLQNKDLGFAIKDHKTMSCLLCRTSHKRTCHYEILSLCYVPFNCTWLVKHAAVPLPPVVITAKVLLAYIKNAMMQYPKRASKFSLSELSCFAWKTYTHKKFVFREWDLRAAKLSNMEKNIFFNVESSVYGSVFFFSLFLMQELLAGSWILLRPKSELKANLKTIQNLFIDVDCIEFLYKFMTEICTQNELLTDIAFCMGNVDPNNLKLLQKFVGSTSKILSKKKKIF